MLTLVLFLAVLASLTDVAPFGLRVTRRRPHLVGFNRPLKNMAIGGYSTSSG
ncbi:MAG TPA: hypothetical protein VGF45_02855 [Polyangia bacterium]